MSEFSMRPRFQITLDELVEDSYPRIKKAIENDSRGFGGTFMKPHMELMFKKSERHFWSPHLQLEFQGEDGKTRICGMIGPNPNVWSMFLAAYAFFTLSSIAIGIVGLSQWMIKATPTFFYYLPITVGLGLLVYVGSFLGKGFALEQTIQLHSFLEHILEPSLPRSKFKDQVTGKETSKNESTEEKDK